MVKNKKSKCQNHEEDCTNFCGLLRKAELYKLYKTEEVFFILCEKNVLLTLKSMTNSEMRAVKLLKWFQDSQIKSFYFIKLLSSQECEY